MQSFFDAIFPPPLVPVGFDPDKPTARDVEELRRAFAANISELRQVRVERDCFKSELLRVRDDRGALLHTAKSLEMRVKMYARALKARVRASAA